MNKDLHFNRHLSALIGSRDKVEAEMAQYLAGRHRNCATDEHAIAAHGLVDVLLDGLAGSGDASPLNPPSIRQYASRFGDGLSPVLRDVLGPDLPDAFLARCIDRYWVSLQTAVA